MVRAPKPLVARGADLSDPSCRPGIYIPEEAFAKPLNTGGAVA